MGSSRRWLRKLTALGASAALLAVMVGCTSVTSPRYGDIGPFATGLHGGGSSSATGSGAVSSGVSGTVGKITAKFDYRDRLITPLAHLYGKFLADFVTITIKNANTSPVKVIAMSEIPGFTNQATDTVTINAGASKAIVQNPRLTTTAINDLNSEKKADVHVVISYLDNGQSRTVLDQTEATTVTSRRDFPWAIDGMSDKQDYELLAAMITPTDPKVEELITKAAQYDPDKVMTSGYDKADDADGTVQQRLSDLWEAETKDYHLTYVSTTETFDQNSQRIRLPTEVLAGGSGNCIETSLLFAAATEALGMTPVIIIVPGHAYMGVNVDGQGDSWYFIETTMIGRYTFAEALKEGGTEWDDAAPSIEAGDKDYGYVNVLSARKDGITPIPWN
ncbi:MAG TPA: hypothetical protein VF337_07165 [Candidatus Limnocylindrales bacterium]